MSDTLRKCLTILKEKEVICYFHCWEQNSKPVPFDVIVGTPPGMCSAIYGIVEAPDGYVYRVPIEQIKFVDESSLNLYAYNMSIRNKN